MERIRNIRPVKDFVDIDLEIFEIADFLLPKNCFWREEDGIHIDVLKFVSVLVEEDKKIFTELICFYCPLKMKSLCER